MNATTDPNPASLTCQQCHQPLLLDQSIASITPSQYSLITSSLPASAPPTDLSVRDKLLDLPSTSREGAEIWGRHNLSIAAPDSSKAKVDGPKDRNSDGRRVGGAGGMAESFIFLGDSVIGQPQSRLTQNGNPTAASLERQDPLLVPPPGLSRSALAHNLHALISSRTPISHPLCIECISILQVELQKELDELSKERDAYIAFEQGILRSREALRKGYKSSRGYSEDHVLGEYDIEGTQEEWDELVSERKELEEEERRLIAELAEKEKQLEIVKAEEEDVLRQEEEMNRQEEEFLLNHHSLSTRVRSLHETLQSAQTHLLLSTSLLQHLESANVYNDAFQIGSVPLIASASPASSSSRGGTSGRGVGSGALPHVGGSGYVGTINGLRLGGRPVVEWEEINAAWGLVALCVDRVAAKAGYVFEKYKIMPLGSYSRIDELPPSKNLYELHASADLASYLHNRRFSTGLICLLDCIRQLVEFGQKGNRGWPVGSLEIRKDRISGYSIRLPSLTSGMAMPGFGGMSIIGLGGSTSPSAAIREEGSGQGRDRGGTAAGMSQRDRDRRSERDREKERGSELTPDEHWTKACMAVLKVLKQILIAESEAEKAVTAEGAPVVG